MPTARKDPRGLTAWELGRWARPLLPDQRLPRRKPRERPIDLPLVAWTYRHKYSTASMLRRRFPLLLRSASTADRALRRLRALGFVRHVGIRGGRFWPAVYGVTPRGVRRLRSEMATRTGRVAVHLVADAWKARGFLSTTAGHELAVSELGLAVEQMAVGPTRLVWLERRFNRQDNKLRFPHRGQMRAVVPDLGFAVRLSPGSGPAAVQANFCELDLGSESGPVIREKLWRYGIWGNEVGPSYVSDLYDRLGPGLRRFSWRLLVVCHDPLDPAGGERRAAIFAAEAQELPTDLRNRLWITSGHALRETMQGGRYTDREAWWKLYDSRTWRRQYLDFAKAMDGDGRGRRMERKLEFVRDQLSAMPRHRLLPTAGKGQDSIDGPRK